MSQTTMVFDNDSHWPRRLLHIPTLTSHAWEPGNSYGGHVEPEYFAISYTWGRFELQDGDHPELQHLDFGTPWKIPRVNPERFTQTQFLHIIQSLPRMSKKPVEFLWLDVACIDQRAGSREKAIEIGRQAVIFHGASQVYAWLHKCDKAELQSISDQLYGDWQRMFDPKFQNNFQFAEVASVMGQIIRTLDKYLDDPWFTSVWTLQEAFLRTDSVLLDRNGEQWMGKHDMIYGVRNDTEVPMTLRHFLERFDSINRAVTELPLFFHIPGLQGIRDRIEETGCVGLQNRIPTMLLSASRHRKVGPKNVNDRVYGIMQVFGLKLGTSAPDSPPGASYDLETLEDQLGAKLMESEPVLSQLFTHSKPAPAGKGWRMGYNSQIPHMATVINQLLQYRDFEIMASFGVTTAQNTVVGTFSAPMCVLHTLNSAWSACYNLAVRLDAVPDLIYPPELIRDLDSIDESALLDWTKQAGITISVLLLGRCLSRATTDSDNPTKRRLDGVGLLLQRLEDTSQERKTQWRRLGICWWRAVSGEGEDIERVCEGQENGSASFRLYHLAEGYVEATAKERKSVSILAGKGESWEISEGTLG